MKDESNLGKVPRVYLSTDIQTEECHLVVYKALSATVCLFIDGEMFLITNKRQIKVKVSKLSSQPEEAFWMEGEILFKPM